MLSATASQNPCGALGPDPSASVLPALQSTATLPQLPGLGLRTDLELGGWGHGNGKFTVQQKNLAFDANDNLYVLDGGSVANGQTTGNFLVQRFTHEGVFQGQFSILVPSLGANNNPSHMVIDSLGQIYQAEALAAAVVVFSPSGQLLRTISAPVVTALAVRKVSGNEEIDVVGGSTLYAFRPSDGAALGQMALSQTVNPIEDMTADPSGSLFLVGGALHQIFKFNASGVLQNIIGSGAGDPNTAYNTVFFGSVVTDAQGFIYTTSFGSVINKIDPNLQYMIREVGQFAWNDNWIVGPNYAPLALDHQGRVWVSIATGDDHSDATISSNVAGTNPNFWTSNYHIRPAILRTAADFLVPKAQNTNLVVSSTLGLGVTPQISTNLTGQMAFDPKQNLAMDLTIPATTRLVDDVTILYTVQDINGGVVSKGQFDMPLTNGHAATKSFTFSTGAYGWFAVNAHACKGGQRLSSTGNFFGVTPPFPALTSATPASFTNGAFDAPKALFTGYPSLRLSASQGLDEMDQQINQSMAVGATFFVQLTDTASVLTPSFIGAAMARAGTRVKYWELLNEPNMTGMSPQSFYTLAKTAYQTIHSINPSAQVLGPSLCGVDLNWLTTFYQIGGGATFDIMAIHDYEGNESIDPVHWRWKYAALRTLMNANGDSTKAIWQTERAIQNSRGDNFTGIQQATRMALRYNLLETFGIPAEHNLNYFLYYVGFIASYVWSPNGPFPAALTMRTRQAMIVGRPYQSAVDFGSNGNQLYLGLRYAGSDGSTITLSTLGGENLPLTAKISGAALSVTLVDSFGNSSVLPVAGGAVSLTLGELPVYLRLTPAQSFSVEALNYGTNLAPQATVSYSGNAKTNMKFVNDGIMATYQMQNPNGDTNAPNLWIGALDNVTPQTLTITFASAKTVRRVVVYGVPPDNLFSGLYDFDLEAQVKGAWVPLQKVRSNNAYASPTNILDSATMEWLQDVNHFVLQGFTAVNASAVRLVFYRSTRGNVAPDPWLTCWGSILDAAVMLKEIEIY